MQARHLYQHLEATHGVYRSRVIDRELLLEREERTFCAHHSHAGGSYFCCVPGCGGLLTTPWNLRKHFADRHPWHLVDVPGEGVYPRCQECGMQTNPIVLGRGHEMTDLCMLGAAKRRTHEAAVEAQRALDVRFTVDGVELEQVEAFKYLGRWLLFDDNDRRAINENLKKARKCWKRISRLLRAEGLPPRVAGMFYKAVVMAILLYGSKLWAVAPSALKRLEGFHMQSAWTLARANTPQ